jgi:hypothetical protein
MLQQGQNEENARGTGKNVVLSSQPAVIKREALGEIGNDPLQRGFLVPRQVGVVKKSAPLRK